MYTYKLKKELLCRFCCGTLWRCGCGILTSGIIGGTRVPLRRPSQLKPSNHL